MTNYEYDGISVLTNRRKISYILNMKLLLAILLTTALFAQDKSNQNLFAIKTTSQYYKSVSIDSVYDLRVELYDKLLDTKLDIPIAEIKSLKQWGLRPNIFGTIIGTAAGAGCGTIAAFYAMMIFHGNGNTTQAGAAIVTLGGSVMLGYKLGRSIFKREYKVVEFDGWTLDEKRNYLVKSKVKQLSGPQKFLQHLRGFSLRMN